MAERTGEGGTKGRKKSLGRRAPPPPTGRRAAAPKAQPARAAARKPKPERATAPGPHHERAGNGGTPPADWAELADRAARKVAELVGKARPYVERARPAAERAAEAGRKMAVDLEGGLDEAFGKVAERARDLLSKGQHTRVQVKFRGRTLAELPIAAVAAAEAASLWWFGPLRLLLGHLVGKSVLEVEFVSSADEHVASGRAFLADGDVDQALAEFDRALSMDRRCAGAHLGRGIALKLRGDKAGARAAFERAEELDAHGEAGREARRHLDNLG